MLSAQSLQYKGITRPISNRALDSAYLRITYSLLYISDSLKSNEVWEDRKILLIGDSINHFYSDYLRRSDSSVTVSIDKGKPYRATKFSDNVSYEGYDIYTYPIKRERIVWEHITDLSIYRYREKIEIPQWKISMDTCIILSYTCQKATAHFRGREWEVWFTLEIPIDVGPWKLCGLPGLILKASDSKGHYAFECIGLENLYKKKQPIVMIRGIFGELIECTRLEFLKAQGRFYDNYVNFLLTMGYNVNITDASGNRIEHIETPNTKFAERNVSWSISVDARDRNRKIPYNPIELE
jgi:GLPGLI family protein